MIHNVVDLNVDRVGIGSTKIYEEENLVLSHSFKGRGGGASIHARDETVEMHDTQMKSRNEKKEPGGTFRYLRGRGGCTLIRSTEAI